MKIGRHSMVTDAQRVELWRRYRAGETVLSIANELGQRSSSARDAPNVLSDT
jgi:hypothetical protein